HPQVANSHSVQALADPAFVLFPASSTVPNLVMRVRVGSRQLQVLRLLFIHRLLTAAQVQALAFETTTRRAYEICLQRLRRKGWVVGPSPSIGAPAGAAVATSLASPRKRPTCSWH
ncbi:MAG: hypothetical protein OXG44_06015, partial [Gammaproteobacteria bacterium]|nr:hypothetical protein [Gammaproteobacteria bacterium]